MRAIAPEFYWQNVSDGKKSRERDMNEIEQNSTYLHNTKSILAETPTGARAGRGIGFQKRTNIFYEEGDRSPRSARETLEIPETKTGICKRDGAAVYCRIKFL